MEVSIEVVKEAKEKSLLTVHNAKLGLNMQSTSSTFTDEQIELMISWASNEISKLCQRVFAQQTVIETILEIASPRVYLSQYPVKEITELSENGTVLVAGTDYNIDVQSGKVTRLPIGTWWSAPVVIKYTGGYDLPQRAPPELASACVLLTREAYNASLRGDASIRMITHKQTRIIYFDPNAAQKGGSSGGAAGSPARRATQDIIRAYTRIVV